MAEQINILIVEDESIVAMDLAAGMEKDGYAIAGIADNYEEAKNIFLHQPVDLVLMDIHIEGEKDGIETAVDLMKIKTVPLIYLTAFTDAATVARVKQTNASAFLTKPYSLDNVRIAIELALHNFAITKSNPGSASVIPLHTGNEKKPEKEPFLQLNDYLFIKQNYRFVKFRLDEFLYAEADNNYVNIHTRTQKFSLRLSLSDLLERVKLIRLVRIHRSYAVNINEISSFDDEIVRIGEKELPLGRNFRQTFMDQFNWR